MGSAIFTVATVCAMQALLLALAWVCLVVPAVRGGMCTDPKGEDGESYQDGCILHKCKSGVWRPSPNRSVCCYNGETYPFSSTITTITSEDSCISTHLECQEDGVKAIITQHRDKKGCSPPASSKQIREIKCMLKQHILEEGCSSSFSPEINTSSSGKNISGILISGGLGEGALATELFLVGTKQVCALPPLPHRRFFHSLDVFNQVPVMCGGDQEDGKFDENIERSCLQFTPYSDCGTWKNFTTLQEPLWGHTSWISKDGLVFFGHMGDVEMLSFDGKSHIIREGDLTNKGLYNSGLGWFHMDRIACGIDDEGDSFISTGGMQGKNVAVRYNMREKTLLKLPSMNVEREYHGCGMYLDQNGGKVYLVAGGWAGIDYHTTTELLTEAATAWTFSSPLPRTLKGMASVSLDNKVFFIGGEVGDWREKMKERNEILAFDGNGWTEVGQLQIPRKNHAATVVDASNLMGFC